MQLGRNWERVYSHATGTQLGTSATQKCRVDPACPSSISTVAFLHHTCPLAGFADAEDPYAPRLQGGALLGI
jgi:hypothetical protein